MPKISLILEGGGMRGVYSAGVLDFFLDKGILFHHILGVSAGACNAVSYISRQRGRDIYIYKHYSMDKRYLSLSRLFTHGSVFGMNFIFYEIPNKLVPLDYDQYNQSNAHFTIVATDCHTGKPVYFDGSNAEAAVKPLIASSSLPLFAKMAKFGGKRFLDGGASESIPILRSIEEGHDRHVLVLTRCKGYRKKKSRLDPVYARYYEEYPALVHALQNRYKVYNESLDLCERLEREGKALIIRPSRPVKIDRFEKDPRKLQELYDNGIEDAVSQYRRLVKFCSGSETVTITESKNSCAIF